MPRLQRTIRRIRDDLETAAIRTRGRPSANAGVMTILRTGRWIRQWFPLTPTSDGTIAAIHEITVDPAPVGSGQRVLVMSPRWWNLHVAFDWTLSQALRRRGAEVSVLTCAGGLPACEVGRPAKDGERMCQICTSHTGAAWEHGGITVHQFGSSGGQGDVSPDDESLVRWSLLWKLRRGETVGDEVEGELSAALRHAAAQVREGVIAALEEFRPDVVVMLNGLFFEEAVLRIEAAARGVRIVTYEGGQRHGTFFFAHGEDSLAPRYDITPLWERVRDRALTADEQAWVTDQLAARRSGPAQPKKFFRHVSAPDLPPTSGRLRFALFTNVVWDSAVIDRHVAFSSMVDWVDSAIACARSHPDAELVIRAHPAETRGDLIPTETPIMKSIAALWPELPENVVLVGPNDPVDSYSLLDEVDGVLVYTSTVGIEAACAGIPVAVAGDTHYRGRGFTFDLANRDDLDRCFRDLSWAVEETRRSELARRYFHALLRRALLEPSSVGVTRPQRSPHLKFDRTSDLDPGNDVDLDTIVDAILDGGPFEASSVVP